MIYSEKEKCTACSACVNKCPVSAIRFELDENGFIYPSIDESKCIKCGLCEEVCMTRKQIKLNRVLETKVVVLKDRESLKKSSSGGLFYGLAKGIIEKNGIVYGSCYVYDEDGMKINHLRIDALRDIKKVQGSKYARSNIKFTYREAEKDLKEGKIVLFTGTPCQIAGLYHYLGRNYENLYAVDFICHGVPEQELFHKYLKFLGKKKNGKIVEFCFRNKKYGWGHVCGNYTIEKVDGRRKTYKMPSLLSSYYNLYLNGYINRENCYGCEYANKDRVSDITMGDYWGIQREHPEILKGNGGVINPQKGVSCLLINTSKGFKLFNSVKEDFYYYNSLFDKVQRDNARLKVTINRKDDLIIRNLNKKDYNEIESFFRSRNEEKQLRKKYYKIRFKSIFPQGIRNLMKMINGRLK